MVGTNAAFIALGMEASVYVFDRNIDRLRELDIALAGRVSTCFASTLEIEQRLPDADLVIGAVLVHGARAPKVVTRAQLSLIEPADREPSAQHEVPAQGDCHQPGVSDVIGHDSRDRMSVEGDQDR